MPIFEYTCTSCHKNFEEITFKEDKSPACPYCKSTETKKLISCCRHKNSDTGFGGGDYDMPSMPSSAQGGGCAGCAGGSCSTCH